MIRKQRYPPQVRIVNTKIRVGEWWCAVCDSVVGEPPVFYTRHELEVVTADPGTATAAPAQDNIATPITSGRPAVVTAPPTTPASTQIASGSRPSPADERNHVNIAVTP